MTEGYTVCPHCGGRIRPCRSCGARMIWATSMNDKPWPLDAGLTTIAELVESATASTTWRVVRGHVPHHITCPEAEGWHR